MGWVFKASFPCMLATIRLKLPLRHMIFMKIWGQTKSRDHCTAKVEVIAQQFYTLTGLVPFDILFTLLRTHPSNWNWLAMFEMGKLIYSDILSGILWHPVWHSSWHILWHSVWQCVWHWPVGTWNCNVWARVSIVARHLLCNFTSKHSRPRCSGGLCLVCWVPGKKMISTQVQLYLSPFCCFTCMSTVLSKTNKPCHACPEN